MINGNVSRQILIEELEQLRLAIIKHHTDAGQVASGRTIKSLHVEATEYEGTLYGHKPFGVLETGRRGGAVPSGFTGIILQWMKDKGIKVGPIPYKTNRPHKYTPQERGNLQFSYFVAQKIKKSGTLLYRQGGRADIYSNEIPQTVEKVGQRLLKLFGAEISSIKLNKETKI